MDGLESNHLNEPLLAGTDNDSDDDEVFHDVHSSASSIVSSASKRLPPLLSTPLARSTPQLQHYPITSYFGTASKLATGSLFPNSHGIVDTIPSTDEKPCLIFSDSDIYSAIAHICLLEKEVYNNTRNDNIRQADGSDELLPLYPKLFSVVHACKFLIKQGDAGMRILKKLNKGRITNTINGNIEIPVLLYENNILRETSEVERERNGLSSLLLPRFIDETIGAKHVLSGSRVTNYNMNLFIQRHTQLPNLFHSLLTSSSSTHRMELSTKLLSLLKIIDSDLQLFQSGPYLCGNQFTLADISIFPTIERIVVVLSVYRNFWIPPSLTHLIHWYEIMCGRPAIRVATADRTEESMRTYCYEKKSRNEYLLEVYECYALHEEVQFQQLNDDIGRAGVNVYRDVCEDMEERERMAICERGKNTCEQCIIS